jgi:hypothetical protein
MNFPKSKKKGIEKYPKENSIASFLRAFAAKKDWLNFFAIYWLKKLSGHIGTGTPQECQVGSKYFNALIHLVLRCQI